MKKDNDFLMVFLLIIVSIFGYMCAIATRNKININNELDKETTAPIVKVSIEIDLDKIWMIESSRGKNLWNEKTRARGHYQFIKSTWDECIKKMKKDWDWWNDSMDKEKSEQVAHYYYNVEIPRLLKYYKIDDTIETRIACYSWGIRHLDKKGIEFIPEKTKKYIRDYYNL